MNELKNYIDRLERLDEDKKGIQDDINEVMKEMKNKGFDLKAVRAVLKLRKMDPADREELSYLTDEYLKLLDSGL